MALHTRALFSGVFFVCLRGIAASGVAASVDARQGPKELALTLIQASARAHVSPPVTPNLEAPRMYVCEGCDGSTATLTHAVSILALHGVDAGIPSIDREFLRSGGSETIAYQNDQYRKQNQTLVFKSIIHRDKSQTLTKSLKDMGTLAVYVTRKNQLDHLVCLIRDCFWTNDRYGYPVSGTGKKSNLCFQRRSDKKKVEKAYVNVETAYVVPRPNPAHPPKNISHLKYNLEHVDELHDEGYAWLKKAGYRGPRFWYEDICAFEKGGADNVKTSMKLWVELLKAWGVNADHAVLEQYLKSKAGTWRAKSQRSVIYNYKEVVEELKALKKEHLLRD